MLMMIHMKMTRYDDHTYFCPLFYIRIFVSDLLLLLLLLLLFVLEKQAHQAICKPMNCCCCYCCYCACSLFLRFNELIICLIQALIFVFYPLFISFAPLHFTPLSLSLVRAHNRIRELSWIFALLCICRPSFPFHKDIILLWNIVG